MHGPPSQNRPKQAPKTAERLTHPQKTAAYTDDPAGKRPHEYHYEQSGNLARIEQAEGQSMRDLPADKRLQNDHREHERNHIRKGLEKMAHLEAARKKSLVVNFHPVHHGEGHENGEDGALTKAVGHGDPPRCAQPHRTRERAAGGNWTYASRSALREPWYHPGRLL